MLALAAATASTRRRAVGTVVGADVPLVRRFDRAGQPTVR